MKITILAYGSRGDIQPFLALAVGLKKAGHVPTLAAPQTFEQLITRSKVSFYPLPGDPQVISSRFNDAGQNPVATIRAISDYVFEIAPQVVQAAINACAGAELIIHGFLFTAGGHAIACEQNIPDISVQIFPMFAPTRSYPNVSVANLPPGWLSYASHWVFDRVFRYGGAYGFGRIRRQFPDLPLPAKLPWPFESLPGRSRTPLVFAFSPSVLPPAPEWQGQSHIHIPGYFFLEEDDHVPPAMLVDFLASGEAPVCITFGSMVNRNMESIRSTCLEALRRTHKRAIVLTGWGDWGLSSTDDLMVLDSAAHSWLFPRCSLIIHHGGAGTTGAALRAGVPSMVIPLAGDQPFWAKIVDGHELGPHSIGLRDLSVERLAKALIEADSPIYLTHALEMRHRLGKEDGVGSVIRLVEQYK
jgi:sterol 3beta-glucosyltransferase